MSGITFFRHIETKKKMQSKIIKQFLLGARKSTGPKQDIQKLSLLTYARGIIFFT